MNAFKTWGTELFRPDVPVAPDSVQESFYLECWGWGPLDAPLEMPAGATIRLDRGASNVLPPVGFSRWILREGT